MPCVIRPRLGLGLVVLLLAGAISAGAIAAAPPAGPRLAFVKVKLKPPRSEVATVGLSGDASRLAVAPLRRFFMPFNLPAWSPDGTQLAVVSRRRGDSWITVLSSNGGGPRVVPHTKKGLLPVFAPDGRSIAFTRFRQEESISATRGGKQRRREFESSSVWTVDLPTGRRRQLTPWRNGLDQFASSFSPDGLTLYLTRIDDHRSDQPEVVALRLDGSGSDLLVDQGSFPVASPDGSRIAFIQQLERVVGRHGRRRQIETTTDLYVVNADGSGLRRLTHTPKTIELFSSWDPSGQRIAYLQLHRGNSELVSVGFGDSIVQINADGTCASKVLSVPHAALYGPAWQPGPGREAGRIDC